MTDGANFEKGPEQVIGSGAGGAEGESRLYPAFLKLQGRRALVVGGGPVAFQKARELVQCGARLHVVATAWPVDFTPLEDLGDLTRTTRPFVPEDLDGVTVVIAATDDPDVQGCVHREAQARGVLCNVVDVPDLCGFYVPATLRRGALTVSVSTQGKSPLLARALRDRLAGWLGPHLGAALDSLGEARRWVRGVHPSDAETRRAALERLVTPEGVEELLAGRIEAFEARQREWRKSWE